MEHTDRIKELDNRIRDREETLWGIESPYERQEVEESIAQLKEERAKMERAGSNPVGSIPHPNRGCSSCLECKDCKSAYSSNARHCNNYNGKAYRTQRGDR